MPDSGFDPSLINNTVSVDIGGTFTDCFVAFDGKLARGKQPTTRYRLAVGFNNALQEAAEQIGMDSNALLAKTDMVRYATTLAMNALLERKGPKLGLITSAGFEDTILIGRGAQWHDGLPVELKRLFARGQRPIPIIPRQMVVGLRERIGPDGAVIIPLNEQEVRDGVRRLVDQGAMGFIVAFNWSHINPKHEQMVREITREEFPDIYLGAQPILLSSEVSGKAGEYQRDMTAILAGYLHRTMAEELTELAASLRERGYERSLYVMNSAGGANPLERTSAVHTYNAGPVAAVIGGAYVAEQYGTSNVILTDMGGTSFDIGTVVDLRADDSELGRKHFYSHIPMIGRFRVGISMIETKSIGAGGGSIARFDEMLQIIEVGPQSAGSNPGPACFGLGGDEPTVTDADVVLGYIDPEYFLGGQVRLNRAAAETAIRKRVAEPAGLTVEEAAFAIRQLIDAKMGNEIYKETHLKGYDPREFDLYAFGGAGGAHACGYAKFVQSPVIRIFPFGSVFSAYGITNADFVRTYEQSASIRLYSAGRDEWLNDTEEFNRVVRALQTQALRDADDLGVGHVEWMLELEMRYGLQPHQTRIRSPRIFVDSEDDVRAIGQAFEDEYARIYSRAANYREGGIDILSFVLWSVVRSKKVSMPTFELGPRDPSAALRGKRRTFWGPSLGWPEVPVYELGELLPGAAVSGPAVVGAPDTTLLIDPGWQLEIDRFRNGVMRRMAGEGEQN